MPKPGHNDQLIDTYETEEIALAVRDGWARMIVSYELQGSLTVFTTRTTRSPGGSFGKYAVYMHRNPDAEPNPDSVRKLMAAILSQRDERRAARPR